MKFYNKKVLLILIAIILTGLILTVFIQSSLSCQSKRYRKRSRMGGGSEDNVGSSTNWPDPCRFNHLLDGGVFPGKIPTYEDARQALLRIGVQTNETNEDLFNKVEQYFPRDGNSCDLDPNCGWCRDDSEEGGKCLSVGNSSTCPKDKWWNGWKDSCSFSVESVDNKRRDDQSLVRDPTRDEVRWELLLKGETVDSNDNELEEKAARFLPRDQKSCGNPCGWCVESSSSISKYTVSSSTTGTGSENNEQTVTKKLKLGKCVHRDTSGSCAGWWEGSKCIKDCQTMNRLQKHRQGLLNLIKGRRDGKVLDIDDLVQIYEKGYINQDSLESGNSSNRGDEGSDNLLCNAYSDLSERNGIPDCQYDMYDAEGVCQISDTGLDVKNRKISCKDACQKSISGYRHVVHQYCPVKLGDNRSVNGERCYCLRYGKESE